MRRCLPAALLILLSTAMAFAQGGPPMRTDDPGTPGNGNFEINIAATSERSADERLFEAPVIDANYGVGDRLQLNFEIPWVVRGADGEPTRNGLGNSSAAVKWRFFESAGHNLQISVYPRLDFNNDTASVRKGLADRGRRLLMPVEITKKFGPVDANVEGGYAIKEFGSNEWLSGMVLGHEFHEKLELMGEFYATGTTDGLSRDMSVDAGTRYRLGKHVLLIMMVGKGVGRSSSAEPNFVGYGGLQFSFASRHSAKAEQP